MFYVVGKALNCVQNKKVCCDEDNDGVIIYGLRHLKMEK